MTIRPLYPAQDFRTYFKLSRSHIKKTNPCICKILTTTVLRKNSLCSVSISLSKKKKIKTLFRGVFNLRSEDAVDKQRETEKI